MRAPITSATTTTLGALVLVAGASWSAASKWFGFQKQIALEMARTNSRLAVIEAHLNIRPGGTDDRFPHAEAPGPARAP